jgi:predicted ArsR family transcriptional regulator
MSAAALSAATRSTGAGSWVMRSRERAGSIVAWDTGASWSDSLSESNVTVRRSIVKEGSVSEAYAAVAVLADPVRRRLYEYVAGQSDAVSREQAAAESGVPVHSARFHLDRLVTAGLLSVEHRRLTGRSGPGAGRPAKLYRRSDATVEVSVPPRRYDLVGSVLAAAVERSLAGDDLDAALAEEARAAGRSDGATLPGEGRDESERCAAVLAGRGFEPSCGPDGVILRNCPFDALAQQHTALVCRLNHDYVDGVIDGLGCHSLKARLDPADDRCCVRLEALPDA